MTEFTLGTIWWKSSLNIILHWRYMLISKFFNLKIQNCRHNFIFGRLFIHVVVRFEDTKSPVAPNWERNLSDSATFIVFPLFGVGNFHLLSLSQIAKWWNNAAADFGNIRFPIEYNCGGLSSQSAVYIHVATFSCK